MNKDRNCLNNRADFRIPYAITYCNGPSKMSLGTCISVDTGKSIVPFQLSIW